MSNTNESNVVVRQVVLVVGALLVVLMSLLLIPIPFKHRAVGAIGDLFHAPLFGGLTFGVLALLERQMPITGWPRRVWSRIVCVAASAFAFGVAGEIFQSFSGRTAAWQDALANGLGILVATVLFVRFRLIQQQTAGFGRGAHRGLLGLAIGLLLVAWTPPIRMLAEVAMVYQRFPTLGSFETPLELQVWYFRNSSRRLIDQNVTDGRLALEMTVHPAELTGHPAELTGTTAFEFPGDWSAMRALALDVRLDDEHAEPTANLTIQFVDSKHVENQSGFFRQSFELQRGQTQTIRVLRSDIDAAPSWPPIDLSRIRYLDLFLISPPIVTKVFIDHVRLELD